MPLTIRLCKCSPQVLKLLGMMMQPITHSVYVYSHTHLKCDAHSVITHAPILVVVAADALVGIG